MIDITTIIPVYNRRNLIGKAIQSALAQPVKQQILVVDDGSTDGSAEACEVFKDAVTVLKQRNLGPAAARHTGLLAAKGEFVAFLDSDDTWLPGKLESQLAAFEPGVELVHGLVDWSPGRPQIPVNEFAGTSCGWKAIFQGAWIITPTVMIRRRTAVRVGGFDTRLRHWEDRDLWLRVTLHGTVVLIPRPTAFFGFTDSRASSDTRGQAAICWRRSSERALREARGIIPEAELRECHTWLQQRLVQDMCGAFWHGNTKALRRLAWASLLNGPRRLAAVKYLLGSLAGQWGRNAAEKLDGRKND